MRPAGGAGGGDGLPGLPFARCGRVGIRDREVRAMTDLTEGRRVYAIGDIHGRLDLLGALLARIRSDLAARPHPHPLVNFLGDYADRGPDSRGVLDALIALEATGLPTTFMFGNHDSYVLAFLTDPEWTDLPIHWLHPSMGGGETLASYGVPDPAALGLRSAHAAFSAAVPAAHVAVLERCRLSMRLGTYAFVHAGIRPGVALEAQAREDLIWIREPFLSSTEDFGFKVVHGHTIVPRVEHHPNRIAIDTGAVRSGVLSCLVLEGAEAALLAADGLHPLPPGAGLDMPGRPGWR
jgi:serine/threonine protein phosphatase 1